MSNRSLKDPVKDPHLAIAEVLILVMAPVMVTLSAAIQASTAPSGRPYTLIALGWMLAAAATTSIVHFVELTVGRQLGLRDLPDRDQIFGFGGHRSSTPSTSSPGTPSSLLRSCSRPRHSTATQRSRPVSLRADYSPHRPRRPGDRSHPMAWHRDLRLRRRLPRNQHPAEPLLRHTGLTTAHQPIHRSIRTSSGPFGRSGGPVRHGRWDRTWQRWTTIADAQVIAIAAIA